MRSKRVVLHGPAIIYIFEQLLLFLGMDEMLDSFYALEWAFKEIAYVGLMGVGLIVLVVVFLGFFFGVSAEMDCCVGVVAKGVAFE